VRPLLFRLLLLPALVLCLAGLPDAMAQAAGADKLPDFPFPGTLGERLKQTSEGFFFDGARLPLDPTPAMQAAAAYYARDGILVSVSRGAEAVLYSKSNGKLLERARQSAGPEAALRMVHFTRVPGLLYLFWTDMKKAAELRKGNVARQEYPDRFSRVALTEIAERFDAMPVSGQRRENGALEGCYLKTQERIVPFSTRPGAWSRLELGEPLGKPFLSGPGDSLAQSIFFFGKNGILSRTREGWSLSSPAGKLRQHFSTSGIQAIWWRDPTREKRGFRVHAALGPATQTYLLDEKSARLVETPR
jgi:hypothetical protein